MRKGLVLFSSLLLTSLSVHASNTLMIDGAYARATPPNAPTSAVFFTAHNHSDSSIDIVSATTPAAKKVELHTVVMDGDVMKMRQLDALTIDASGELVLKPGSYHVMLFELTREFVEGDDIKVTLSLSDGTTQTIVAPIKKVMAGMSHHKH